jgi:hypothetical protein
MYYYTIPRACGTLRHHVREKVRHIWRLQCLYQTIPMIFPCTPPTAGVSNGLLPSRCWYRLSILGTPASITHVCHCYGHPRSRAYHAVDAARQLIACDLPRAKRNFETVPAVCLSLPADIYMLEGHGASRQLYLQYGLT